MEGQRTVEQLCRLVVVAVFLPGTVFCDATAGVPVSTTVEVISATHRYFTTSCVFLIHEEVVQTNLNQRLNVVRLQKLLKGSEVAVSTVSLVALFGLRDRTHISCSRSLHVLLFSGSILLDGIRQLATAVSLSHAIWLLFLDKDTSLEEFFTDINIPFDCEFLVAQPEADHVVGLTEVYRVSPSLPLQTYRFGNWTPGGGLTWPSRDFYHRRSNLQGLDLGVAVNNDSLTIVTGTDRNDVLEVGGLFGQMWRTAERYRNFTSHYSMSNLNLHGELLEDGKWDGIIGMLAARQVDVSCSDLTMTTSRVDVVDFIEPIWADRTYIFVKKPDTVAIGWTAFLMPYSWQLWLAVTVTVTLLVFCLAAVYYVRSQYVGHTDGELPRCGLSLAVFYIAACFCGQGSNIVPRGVSCRTVYITAYLMSVVMLTSYSGSLVSSIASRHDTLSFRTFEEFLNDGTYRLGVVANSSIISNMKESSETPLRKLYESMLPDMRNLPKRNNEGLRRACEDERYAYMSPLYVLLTNAAICTLQTVPHAYISSNKAMAIVKDSPYRLVLKQTFRTIRRSGIFRRICGDTLISQPQEEGTTFHSVDQNAVSPLLTVLFIGILVSIFMLIVERKYSHSQHCRYHKYALHVRFVGTHTTPSTKALH